MGRNGPLALAVAAAGGGYCPAMPDTPDVPAPAPASAPTAERVPNIGAHGKKVRSIWGGAFFALGLIGAVRLVILRLPAFEMFGPSLAFLAAGIGYFQARDSTCVFLAATGGKDPELKGPKAFDAAQRDCIRRQATRVVLQALGSAVVLTAAFVALALWRT